MDTDKAVEGCEEGYATAPLEDKNIQCAFDTSSFIPFRVVDDNLGIDADISVRCTGTFSYRVASPHKFSSLLDSGSNGMRSQGGIKDVIESELTDALKVAFEKISKEGVEYSHLPEHAPEVLQVLKAVLFKKWANSYGIELVAFDISSIEASEEDEDMIKDLLNKKRMN